jgi:hypothetical protein
MQLTWERPDFFPHKPLTENRNMPTFRRFEWNSEEYSDAFACLLRCSSERSVLIPFLQRQIQQLPIRSAAADWGAGRGDLTQLLDQHCSPTFAIEPSPVMRQILKQNLPNVRVLAGDLLTASPPGPIDYALLAHVLYHLPDEAWPQILLRLLDFQSPDGQLVIILKGANSGCNLMLERFGAQRFDLTHQLSLHAHMFSDFEVKADQLSATVQTNSYEETEKLARFMMCDRGLDQFSTPPDEADFVKYVTTELWDPELKRGGWDYEITACTITKRTNQERQTSTQVDSDKRPTNRAPNPTG